MWIVLAESSQATQALGLSGAALALGTLIANAWSIWVRRLEKKDEHAKDIAKAAQDAGIVELRGDVEHLTEKVSECEEDRNVQRDEIRGLRDMILGRHVEPKEPKKP